MNQPICDATTKRGTPCRIFALPGHATCTSHTPEFAEQMREARARGGANASKLRALQGRRSRLDSVTSLMRFTSQLIQATLADEVPPEVARAVFAGISLQRQLVGEAEPERRLTRLERRVPRVVHTGA